MNENIKQDVQAEVLQAFAVVPTTTSGRHVYDFIGTCTRAAYKKGWDAHALPAGRTYSASFPQKNEHYLDWVAVLQAVCQCNGVFRMAELGAGWAPWTVRAALATRQRPEVNGLELLAIEADPAHYQFMLEHFRDNGLDPARFHLLHGAASDHSGSLRFPVIPDPDVDYGASLNKAKEATETIAVQGYTVPELLDRFTGSLDFLHVDIQGAEYDCLPPAMYRLKRSVKSIMIGTHTSDAAHDGLAQRFRSAGWLEILNLPRSRISATPWGNIKLDDGFLWYRNPDLY